MKGKPSMDTAADSGTRSDDRHGRRSPAAVMSRIAKPLSLTIMAIVLFAVGAVLCVYSPWFQDTARQAVVQMMNRKPGTRFDVQKLRLWFPLRVQVDGLSWVQDGDTMVALNKLDGRMRLASLLDGRLDVDDARVSSAMYRLGTLDSATCIVMRASDAVLKPASVQFGRQLRIRLDNGLLKDAAMDLYINPNPPKTPADTSAQATPVVIDVVDLDIERLTYRMNMLPTIDSLGVFIDRAHLHGAHIDVVRQTVDVQSLQGSGLDASYIVPDSATIANTVVAPPDSTLTPPWTVTVADFAFDKSRALYTTRGVKPMPGFDFMYISADSIDLSVKNFYNQATTVRIPLALSGTERCGMRLDVTGNLDIDAKGLTFRKFDLSTANGTALGFDGYMGMGDLTTDFTLPLKLAARSHFAPADLALMFPAFKTYLAPLGNDDIGLDLDLDGTMASLDIDRLDLDIPGVTRLNASGNLSNVMAADGPDADIDFAGSLGNVNPWMRLMMGAGSGVVIPQLRCGGSFAMRDGAYTADIKAYTGAGSLALDGRLDGTATSYDISLDTKAFPVQAFMPAMGIGAVTGTIDAIGRGFDILSPSARLDATASIASVEYAGKTYNDITGTVQLGDGSGQLDLRSVNPGLDFDLSGELHTTSPDNYSVSVTLDGNAIDLQSLGVMTEEADLSTDMTLTGTFDRQLRNVNGALRVSRLDYQAPDMKLNVNDINARLMTNDSTVNAVLSNGDMYAFVSTPMPLDSVMAHAAGLSAVLDAQMAEHRISVVEVQRALPRFTVDVDAGSDNLITKILHDSDMSFGHLQLTTRNDSVLSLHAAVNEFQTGTTRLDTITFDIRQRGERLDYQGRIDNRPGTFDSWAHVNLDGFFENNRLGVQMRQRNLQNVTGFDIGANIDLRGDSLAVLKFDPLTPTIAYKPWTINDDNFVSYSFTHRHMDANLHMQGAGSSLALYTEHAHVHDGAAHGADEDLVLQLDNVRLQDWIQLNPFAPSMRGNISADMRINWEDRKLTGEGNMGITDFYYGKERVGDIRADLDVLTEPGGLINADVALWVNGNKSMTLRGALNDSTRTSPFNLDLSMIHFPLATVNPFMPGIARLTGTLNGMLDVTGDAAAPVLNGALALDSATVVVTMLGTKLTVSPDSIPVVNNKVTLDRFAIHACNDNPLTIDGTVDISDLTNASMNLRLAADNMLLVDTRRAPKGADVYGKALLSTDIAVKGDMKMLNINGGVTLLSGTNATYVMTDAATAIQSMSDGDMVKFVNFADTTAVAVADSIAPPSEMLLNIDARLTVQGGTTVNVDLGGSDRVVLQGQGQLNYTQNPLNDGRLTGRLNIDGGFVRYTIPMMGEKLFNFNEGSYVAFNGDMMNPLLNIHAVDRVRANVTQSGQNSRLIYFDVDLGVTGSLNNMNVAFDLATDDDATVANELATMSPSQRASAAMNLLVTNMYTGGDTKGNANLGGNALYSFLTSQLNSWAANTIKGVDLSFGISQYDRTVGGATSQTTQYSYRVSKALFNDRFKIVIGGNYSTDDDANQNLAQNLINDVSIEYMLNKAGSMYVRIFRHTGYESILEGEITQTGVGFVYKRKLNNLRSLFRRPRRHSAPAPQPAEPAQPAQPSGSDQPAATLQTSETQHTDRDHETAQ